MSEIPTSSPGHKEGFSEKSGIVEARDKVKERVKNGDDREGNLIYKAYEHKLQSSDLLPGDGRGAVGNIAATWRAADKLAERVKNGESAPGGLEKLRTIYSALHKQAGLEGDYKIKIPEDTPAEKRQEVIKQKLLADQDKLKEAAFNHLMADYYDQRAKVEILAEDLRRMEESGKFDRSKFRETSYKQAREEDRLEVVESKMLTRVGQKGVEASVKEARISRRSYSPKAYESIADRQLGDQDVVKQEVEKRIETLRGKSEDERGVAEKHKAALDSLNEEKRNELTSNLLDVELHLQNKKENLQKAINAGKPVEVSRYVGEIRRLNLEQKAAKGELVAALASQRRKDSYGKKARDHFQEAFRRTPFKAVGDFTSEIIASHIDTPAQKVTIVDKINNFHHWDVEQKQKVVNFIDKRFGLFRRIDGGISRRFRGFKEKWSSSFTRTSQEWSRMRLTSEQGYRMARYEFEVNRRKLLLAITTKREIAKEKGGIVGATKSGEITWEEADIKIKKLKDEKRSSVEKRYSEFKKEANRHLDFFTEKLEKHVELITTAPAKEIQQGGQTQASMQTVVQGLDVNHVIELNKNKEKESKKLFSLRLTDEEKLLLRGTGQLRKKTGELLEKAAQDESNDSASQFRGRLYELRDKLSAYSSFMQTRQRGGGRLVGENYRQYDEKGDQIYELLAQVRDFDSQGNLVGMLELMDEYNNLLYEMRVLFGNIKGSKWLSNRIGSNS